LQPGDLISGKYRLLRPLGAGGMGSVWAARNELTDRDFAIKFLLPTLAQSKEALQRFFQEARACGQIKHPAVVDVYDMGQAEDGSPYLVMELLEGEGFDHRLHRAGIFRPAEAAAWLAFVARGLEEAHVRGLVHRDLKPGNIFFALDDRGDVIPKVLDFGVSKVTRDQGDFNMVKTTTGAVLGSPTYMSPEQASGDPDVDGRADVWSLGVILYEALTGTLPFDAANYNALMVSIITRPHRPANEVAPGIPADLSAIIDHALEKDRADRIGTARELAERLETVATALGGAPDLPRLQPKTPSLMPGPAVLQTEVPTQGSWSDGNKARRRKQKRSPMLFAGLAMFMTALALAGVLAFMRLRPPVVALAGRSVLALKTHMGELRRELARLKAEEKAEEKAGEKAGEERAAAAASAEPKVVLQPSELPPVPVRKPGSVGGPVGRPPGKRNPDDPHGGVDSAGF
jgi:eukaryotic-like serine/threonine-protein kinase